MRRILCLGFLFVAMIAWAETLDIRISTGAYIWSEEPPEQFTPDTIGFDQIAYYNAVPWGIECAWKKGWFEYGPSLAINTCSYQYSQIHSFLGFFLAVWPVDRGIFGFRGSFGLGVGYAHLFLNDDILEIPGIDAARIVDRLFLYAEPKLELSIGDPGKAYLIVSISERFRYGWNMPVPDGFLLGFGYRFTLERD